MFAFFAAILTSEQIKEKRNRIEKSKQMQENIKDKKQKLKEKIINSNKMQGKENIREKEGWK